VERKYSYSGYWVDEFELFVERKYSYSGYWVDEFISAEN